MSFHGHWYSSVLPITAIQTCNPKQTPHGMWVSCRCCGRARSSLPRYFDNYLKDLIYLETVSATLQKQINAGKAESKGITLELEQRFEKLLRLFANYTYTDARITENSAVPLSVGKRLTYLPDTMVNVGAECEIGPFMASVTGRYVGKRYGDDQNRDTINGVYTSMDPAFTADTKVSYKVTKFATLSFSVDNIFDNSYFSYYKAPGRSWFGGLEVKI